MTKRDLKILRKAHRILDRCTEKKPVNSPLHDRMNEALDGLSTLLYFVDVHHPQIPSTAQVMKQRAAAFYWKHIVGV